MFGLQGPEFIPNGRSSDTYLGLPGPCSSATAAGVHDRCFRTPGECGFWSCGLLLWQPWKVARAHSQLGFMASAIWPGCLLPCPQATVLADDLRSRLSIVGPRKGWTHRQDMLQSLNSIMGLLKIHIWGLKERCKYLTNEFIGTSHGERLAPNLRGIPSTL